MRVAPLEWLSLLSQALQREKLKGKHVSKFIYYLTSFFAFKIQLKFRHFFPLRPKLKKRTLAARGFKETRTTARGVKKLKSQKF